jgi:hypothetical protein
MQYLATSLLALALVGCVDPRGEYESFAGRGYDAGPDAEPSPDGMPVESIPELDGDFYVAAKLNVVATEDKVVHFRATVDYTPITANTGTMSWSAQPLDYRTREPVGAPLVADDIPVGSDGRTDVPFVGVLPARANPVTNTDADLDAMVHVQIRDRDFLCGTITGQGGSLSLDGTTFGAQRVSGALPEPILRCP